MFLFKLFRADTESCASSSHSHLSVPRAQQHEGSHTELQLNLAKTTPVFRAKDKEHSIISTKPGLRASQHAAG